MGNIGLRIKIMPKSGTVKNASAVELGRLGGLKGGKARWRGVSKKKRTAEMRRVAKLRHKAFAKAKNV